MSPPPPCLQSELPLLKVAGVEINCVSKIGSSATGNEKAYDQYEAVWSIFEKKAIMNAW